MVTLSSVDEYTWSVNLKQYYHPQLHAHVATDAGEHLR